MLAILIICADCQRETPDTEGDTRRAFGVDFELCERCATEWDIYGIPAHITADHLG